MRDKLSACKYPGWSIDRAVQKIAHIPQESLLVRRNKPRPLEKGNIVTFTTPYSRQYNQIVSIARKHLPILSIHDHILNTVETGVRLALTKAPTLGSILSPSLFSSVSKGTNWLSTTGFYCCEHWICTGFQICLN